MALRTNSAEQISTLFEGIDCSIESQVISHTKALHLSVE